MLRYDDDEATPICCRACDGRYRITYESRDQHATIVCRWCTRGAQTLQQYRKWEHHKRVLREQGL